MAEKQFLGQNFEFGGTIKDLSKNEGLYCGVYIFALPSALKKVEFNERNGLEVWRGKRVPVAVSELESMWIDGAEILYIGKCEAKSKLVRGRVLDHKLFWRGASASVAAYGGRVIGQIRGYENLQVWYLKCDHAEHMKNELLKKFAAEYGALPFANLK